MTTESQQYPSDELELEWYAEWQQMPGQQQKFSLQEYSHYVIRKACDWQAARAASPKAPQGVEDAYQEFYKAMLAVSKEGI